MTESNKGNIEPQLPPEITEAVANARSNLDKKREFNKRIMNGEEASFGQLLDYSINFDLPFDIQSMAGEIGGSGKGEVLEAYAQFLRALKLVDASDNAARVALLEKLMAEVDRQAAALPKKPVIDEFEQKVMDSLRFMQKQEDDSVS